MAPTLKSPAIRGHKHALKFFHGFYGAGSHSSGTLKAILSAFSLPHLVRIALAIGAEFDGEWFH